MGPYERSTGLIVGHTVQKLPAGAPAWRPCSEHAFLADNVETY